LPLQDLENLTEEILDLNRLEDLERWLDEHSPS